MLLPALATSPTTGTSAQARRCRSSRSYYCALNDKTYPWLAESYEYNDDYTEMTLFMRKGAKWADGEALDAHDVAFTYNTLIAKAPDFKRTPRLSSSMSASPKPLTTTPSSSC